MERSKPSGSDVLRPVGRIRSPLTDRKGAPRQGDEGAPDAWIDVEPEFLPALRGLEAGQDVVVLTWLHLARRETLDVHPRGVPENQLMGVFATRSPDRPNPVGLHRVTLLEIADGRLKVGPIEAVDGTPVIDIKPELNPKVDPP